MKKKKAIIVFLIMTGITTASMRAYLSLTCQKMPKDNVIIETNQVVARDYPSLSYGHAVSPYANLIRIKSYIPADNNNRIFVMGDVHGCLTEMDRLLEKIHFQSSIDTLIMAGDLVYRGNDSVGVLQRAKDLNALCVRGNHDDKVIRFKSFEQQHGTEAMMEDLEAIMPEGQVGDPLKFKSKHATLARYLIINKRL